MSKIIAFSGPCHSGKTTYIEYLTKDLKEKGYNPVFLKEPIRDICAGKSIDEIRSNPSEYLKVQWEIFKRRTSALLKAKENDDDKTVYLEDRAQTDSLFYVNCYIDKTKLNDEDARSYTSLVQEQINAINFWIWDTYDLVLGFLPIDASANTDEMRSANVAALQGYEHANLHLLNTYFDRNSFKYRTVSVDNYNYASANIAVEEALKRL